MSKYKNQNYFDEIIIGSGPSVFGFITAKRLTKKKIAIFSSEAKTLISNKKQNFHLKLTQNKKSIIDPLYGNFGVTHNLGGLSAAWGGVLAVPDPKKIKEIFTKKEKLILNIYKLILIKLKDEYQIFKVNKSSFSKINEDSEITVNNSETYIISTKKKYSWESGGMNIYPLIKKNIKQNNIKLYKSEVKGINKINDRWIIRTPNKTYYANKVILGCGALGNLRILENLDNKFKIQRKYLTDHTPFKIHLLKLTNSLKIEEFKNKSTPISFLKRDPNSIKIFYKLEKLSNNFFYKLGIIGKLFLLMPNLLKKNLYFMQIWDQNTTLPIFIKRRNSGCLSYLFSLMKSGFIPIWITQTKPGEGFHYLNTENIKFNHLLSYYPNLTVLGGNNKFNLFENPTLTFMVDAYVKEKF